MTTFSFYSFKFLKISPYINFKKFLGRILAPPSGRRPGADAPPPAPPRYATVHDLHDCMVKYNEGFQVTLWSCGKLPNKYNVTLKVHKSKVEMRKLTIFE